MNSKKFPHFFFVLLALGLFASLAVGCNEADTVSTPSPTATSAQAETSLPVSPTSTYAYPTITPFPTDIPYPTASIVKANAVAFIEREYWTGNLSLWIVNVDGSGERKLTNIERNDDEWAGKRLLRWSPNGKWISYISGNNLWIISPDGSTKRKLLSYPDKNLGNALQTYVWTPDSAKIIFENTFFDRSITPLPESWPPPVVGIIDITAETITVLPIHNSLTSLTPDGDRILSIKYPVITPVASGGIPHDIDGSSFLLFDINTGKTTEIKPIEPSPLNTCVAQAYDNTHWSWSPNGHWFVYARHGNGPFYNRWLCVSNLDGTVSYEISLSDVNGIYAIPPAWDSTGDYLYLVVRNFDDPLHADIKKPDLRLIKFNVKTREVERLLLLDDAYSDGGGLFWQVSISPDGKVLELDTQMADKYRVDVVDLSSISISKFYISEVPITYSVVYKRWSADSRYIVFSSNHFFRLDVQTGKIAVISGEHSIEYWAISPITTNP